MKVAIVGSRTIRKIAAVEKAVQRSEFPVTHVVSGGAPGVDTLARLWAEKSGIPRTILPAKWRKDGKLDRSAGIKRNGQIEKSAEACVAVWDGKSPGTKDTIERFLTAGKPVFVLICENDNPDDCCCAYRHRGSPQTTLAL